MIDRHYKLVLLIPCFKEGGNLEELINNITKLGLDLATIFIVTLDNVVDDCSVKILEKNKEKNKNLFYITNHERGIGLAYRKGIEYAMDNFDFDFLCTMDADNSHSPSYLPKLLEATDKSDVVIASRYLKNVNIDINGKCKYSIPSCILNNLLRYLFPFHIYDSTSGYKIYSKSALFNLNVKKLISRGFFIQLEILFKLLKSKYKILEVPYVFLSRKSGASKRRIFDICEYILFYSVAIGRLLLDKIFYYLRLLVWLLRFAIKLFIIKIINRSNRKSPFRLMLKITNNCNFFCQICGIWKEGNKGLLSRDQQLKIFEKYKKDLFILTLTGGEPFSDKDYLVNLIDLAVDKCPNLRMISINTNGYFTENVILTINYILQKNEFLNLTIGLNFIPNEDWGLQRTGNKEAYQKSNNTYREIERLKMFYGKRLDFYRIFTVNDSDDINIIYSRAEEVWLNFAEIASFYNNINAENVGLVNYDERKEIAKDFLNNKYLGFFNFVYLEHLIKILDRNREKSRISCFAGRNRIYIDSFGRELPCSRLSNSESRGDSCLFCWTPCEAVFDIIERPFCLIILFLKWIKKI